MAQTDRHTDMATLRPNWPKGAELVKSGTAHSTLHCSALHWVCKQGWIREDIRGKFQYWVDDLDLVWPFLSC